MDKTLEPGTCTQGSFPTHGCAGQASFEQRKPAAVVVGETLAPTAFLLPGGRSLPAPGARVLSLQCLWKRLLLGWKHQYPGSQGKSLKPHSSRRVLQGGAHPVMQPASVRRPSTAGTFGGGWLQEQVRAAHAPGVQVLLCIGLVLRRANGFLVI